MIDQYNFSMTSMTSRNSCNHFQRSVLFKLASVQLKLTFGLSEVRAYVVGDLLRRLGKDCEIYVYGPAKRHFLTSECIEHAEKLIHSIAPDENYIHNPQKLDHWLM